MTGALLLSLALNLVLIAACWQLLNRLLTANKIEPLKLSNPKPPEPQPQQPRKKIASLTVSPL